MRSWRNSSGTVNRGRKKSEPVINSGTLPADRIVTVGNFVEGVCKYKLGTERSNRSDMRGKWLGLQKLAEREGFDYHHF